MSNSLRIIRIVTWGLVAVALFGLTAISLGFVRTTWFGGSDQAPVSSIGGPFTLVTAKGETVTEKTFLGKPSVYFFGFTHCPEVCPTSLLDMTTHLKALGSDADKFNVIFVSVDPERDTPKVLAEYLSAFDPRIVGLTGTPEQVDVIVKAFRVYVKKQAPEGPAGDYNVDHTAALYVMDAQGRFLVPIAYKEDESIAVAKMRRALAS